MRRLIILIFEGAIVGALIGFFVAFITQDLALSVGVGILIGSVVRILVDYVWKKYNQISGKSLD